jgi:ECF transporter S component (folate family)
MLGVMTITRAGLLVAASVVLTRWFGVMVPLAGVGALRLSFGDVPILLAGLTMGPFVGAMVGTAADLVGFSINPMGGAYFPGFTLSAALVGTLPPIFMRAFRGLTGRGTGWVASPAPSYLLCLACIACSDMVTSLTLNTYWIHIMYGKAVAAILPMRILARVVLVPFFAALVCLTIRALEAGGRRPLVAPLRRGAG